MERQIGATDLRQKLTDVLAEVREESANYVIENFGRPQAALVNLKEYRRFRQYIKERESFFRWLDQTAVENESRNAELSEDDVLDIIAQARGELSDLE